MAFDNSKTRLRCLVCFFFFLDLFLIPKTSAQEGFVSLECCAPSNASDLDHNNITWISDAAWFPSKRACRDIDVPVANDTSYKKARVFGADLHTNSTTKWCYNLNTIKEKYYLIRATFLHGSIMRTFAEIFNVSIGATSIAQVNLSEDSLEVEGIFRATDNYSDFCLVKGKGSPYISKLELRPLEDSQYLAGDLAVVWKVISRVDLGNAGEAIRYPNDPSDRIWRSNETYSPSSSIISLPTITLHGANASIPVQILQTALFDPNRLEFIHTDLDAKDNDYMVTLYFLELDPNVRRSQRVFQIYANGVKKAENFDILENGNLSNYREIVFKVENPNGVLNISLIKASDVAVFGPICNAYEVLQVHKKVAGTFQGDVDAIVKVRDELQIENRENGLLGRWSGDPCLPSPWERLLCEPFNGTFVITKLDLSSIGLQGSLPTIISGLAHLKELNVRRNDLMGSIPESFALLPQLTKLDFGCNPHFDNQLPPGLSNRSNLTTDFGCCDGSDSSPSSPSSNYVFIGSIASGSIVFTVAVGAILTFFYKKTRPNDGKKPMWAKNAVFSLPSMDDLNLKSISIQNFSLQFIEAATCKYKTLIEEGGFGSVYRGILPCGQEVAVKVRSATSTQGTHEFENEANPRLRFNKEGSLLAVTTSDNGIKILANTDGQRLIRMLESRTFEGSRGPPEPINTKPPIANSLGLVANVSAPLASTLERSDRISPVVSMSILATMDNNRTDVKPRIPDDVDKIKSWKLADIVDSAQLKALRLPDTLTTGKVVRLIYTNSGLAVLALASNAVHKLWKWQRSDRNPSGKSTASAVPQLWQPANGTLMTNDISDTNPAEESAACIALSKNDSYVMSASGGKVSLFNMMTFKVMTTFMSPPPEATFLAFHPQDNNIIAIGMEDSTIQIYNVRIDEVKTKLKGHQKRITGLAFSQSMNVLVSSGADAQLCVWSIDVWEKRKARFIQAPAGRSAPLVGETKVQFHNDQAHLLVVHESQLSIYDSKLDCLRSWSPRDALAAPISSAIYSCDGLLVYAGFCDGAVGVFDAESLRLRCRIAPSSYITPPVSSNGSVYPMVIAAHPSEPNQIALGMSDGGVHVVEPSDAEPKWGALPPPQENGPSNPSSNQTMEPPPR